MSRKCFISATLYVYKLRPYYLITSKTKYHFSCLAYYKICNETSDLNVFFIFSYLSANFFTPSDSKSTLVHAIRNSLAWFTQVSRQWKIPIIYCLSVIDIFIGFPFENDGISVFLPLLLLIWKSFLELGIILQNKPSACLGYVTVVKETKW